MLDRTDAILSLIEDAASAGTLDGAIASFLTQHATVVFYADMEEALAELFRTRFLAYSKQEIANFIASSTVDLVRRISKKDIADFAGRFGDAFKERFNSLVDARHVTQYSNIIEARHKVGHRRGSTVTLPEVRQGWVAANHILAKLNECLDFECGTI